MSVIRKGLLQKKKKKKKKKTATTGRQPVEEKLLLRSNFSPFPQYFQYMNLAHLSLLRMSFWDAAMSVVRRKCGRPRRPSVNFLACVHSRGYSFDPKFMKLCQNVNHYNI